MRPTAPPIVSLPRNSANKQERSLELVFILAQMTMITFNIKCFRQLYQEYQQNPGCYIEFELMANSVELTRARQKWLQEGNGITRSSFEKNQTWAMKDK